MSSDQSGALDRIRQPEYTGENRCLPCTIVNAAIAVVLGAFVAVVSPPAAVALVVVAALAIYFRGYLVPGTPTLTERYFPDWLLAKFDKGPAVGSEGAPRSTADRDAPDGDDGIDATDPERVLRERGIVEPCADVDDLCLADDAREEFRSRTEAVRDADREEALAAFFSVEPKQVELREFNSHTTAMVDDRRAGRWESNAALLADLAAFDVLSSRLPGWESLSFDGRSRLAISLRAFLERCPDCDGVVSLDEDTVKSCCRSHDVYAVTCEDCGSRILEIEQ